MRARTNGADAPFLKNACHFLVGGGGGGGGLNCGGGGGVTVRLPSLNRDGAAGRGGGGCLRSAII